MRYELYDKKSLANIILGISTEKEKRFKRSVICIKEDSKVFKIISLSASKKDGSISIFFNYCKEKKASISRHRHVYKPGLQTIDESQVTDTFEIEFTVDQTAKLSIHKSGFVQLSGKGILSGIDKKTGRAKGVGVFSSHLDNPVASGPTFGIECWGAAKGFEELTKKEKDTQYIILDKNNFDFSERVFKKGEPPNTYLLEFFIFPKLANNFIFMHKGEPYILHKKHTYIHNPGAVYTYPVIDIQHFQGVIGLFACEMHTGFAEESEFGYVVLSPGGHNSRFETSSIYMFNLVCPSKKGSMLGKDKLRSLDFKTETGTCPSQFKNHRLSAVVF